MMPGLGLLPIFVEHAIEMATSETPPSHAAFPATHHLKVGTGQSLTQPLRQWPRLEAYPADRQPKIGKCCNSASGSLATFVSRTILPNESTTQTLLCSSDTSTPA
jgi:hypothetical protein